MKSKTVVNSWWGWGGGVARIVTAKDREEVGRHVTVR